MRTLTLSGEGLLRAHTRTGEGVILSQTVEAAVRFLITSQINLLAMQPVVGIVLLDVLLLHFALTSAQKQGQLVLWSLVGFMAVAATLTIVGGL